MAVRLEHSGNAPATTLTATLNAGATAFTVADGNGYPTGAVGPFIVTIGAGTASEEKIRCASRSGNGFTVASGGRGYDGTADTVHANASTVTHTFSATEADEANVAAVKLTGVGTVVDTTAAQELINKTITGATINDPTIVSPVIDALDTSSGLGAAWTAYTPTVTGWSLGNGTVTGRFKQIGKIVHAFIQVTAGSTTTFGTLSVSLPVAARATSHSGDTTMTDTSASAEYSAAALVNTVTTVRPFPALTATSPFSWASGDVVNISITYEAA